VVPDISELAHTSPALQHWSLTDVVSSGTTSIQYEPRPIDNSPLFSALLRSRRLPSYSIPAWNPRRCSEPVMQYLNAIDENAVEMRRTALHTTVQTTAQRRGTRTTTSPRKATMLIRVKIGTNILLYTLSAMHVNDARCYSSLSLLSASKDVSSSIQVLVANGDARPALPIFIRPARCYVDRPEHGGRRGNMASCRIRQVPSIVSKSRSMPCRSHHQRQQAG
jgi:hypothetical protein